jgi:hypothetical protein
MMLPPIERPNYLPIEVTDWAQRHREVLELVMGHFCEHGTWPETQSLTRTLAREGRPLDVSSLLRSMPRALGFVEGFPERATLLLFAFRLTSIAQGILAGYIAALRLAVEKFSGEEDPPTLYRSELQERFFTSTAFLDGLSEVLLREAPFLGSKQGTPGEQWNAEITADIVRYWDATTPDRYLELRAQEFRLTPTVTQDAAHHVEPPIEPQTTPALDVFLSHAGEDKQLAARLAAELQARGHSTWFDQAELVVGDSLVEAINDALMRCRFGLVLLSPSFFAKPWPQRELDALFALMAAGESRILPVWHGVDETFIAQRAALLLPLLAADTAGGIEMVADEISAAIRRPQG